MCVTTHPNIRNNNARVEQCTIVNNNKKCDCSALNSIIILQVSRHPRSSCKCPGIPDHLASVQAAQIQKRLHVKYYVCFPVVIEVIFYQQLLFHICSAALIYLFAIYRSELLLLLFRN